MNRKGWLIFGVAVIVVFAVVLYSFRDGSVSNDRISTGNVVEGSLGSCSDGIDNDRDGLTDCGADDVLTDFGDPGCWTDPEDPDTCDESLTEENRATSHCQDGIDNDRDGLIDLEDNGCESRQDYDEIILAP